MATRCNEITLPFQLYFEDIHGFSYHIEELWKSKVDVKLESLPVLKENARIGLQFFTDQKREWGQSFVKIETSRYQGGEDIDIIQCPLTLHRDIQWIYKGENQDEYPWRMGVYFLEVHINGEVYYGGINVVPIHLDTSQVEYIHRYLEDEVKGVIYDFLYSTTSLTESENVDLPAYWYYDYARFLTECYQDFMFSMSRIEKNPNHHVVSTYVPMSRIGNMDQKSIRWAMSMKGLEKNAGYAAPHIHLNKRKTQEVNIPSNRWMKNVLFLWKQDINEVINMIEKDKETLQQKCHDMQEENEKQQDKKRNLSYRSDVGENMMRDVKSKMLMIEKEIQKAKAQIHVLEHWLNLLKQFENNMLYFLNHGTLRETERGFRKPILKNRHYQQVDKMYNESKNIKKEKGERRKLTPILKPTWLIYEYFCLFKILELCKRNGYQLVKGLDDNIVNIYFEDRIPEGALFVLEKEDAVIHVWYDHYHANTLEEAEEKGEKFYTHNAKKKPDIKVDLFDKQPHALLHKSTIVFDAKFSKFKDIYASNYVKKTTEQLAGYYTFFYAGESIKRGSCVDKVICLFAGDGSKKALVEKPPITYINFFPFAEEGDFKVSGESDIEKILEEIF